MYTILIILSVILIITIVYKRNLLIDFLFGDKNIIHNLLSLIDLNKIENILKITYYVILFLIVKTIYWFNSLTDEIRGDVTIDYYIYFYLILFGLISNLLLINYILRSKK